MALTEAAIKKAGSEYDVEVVQRVNISRSGINKLAGLLNCTALLELSLPHNQIIRMEGLGALSRLEKLNLSFNRVVKIEGLEGLSALRRLDLRGNQVRELAGLDGLTAAGGLTHLSLRSAGAPTPGEAAANPVCALPGYAEAVDRATGGRLRFVDGESASLARLVAGAGLAGDGTALSPDPAYTNPLAPEPWATAGDFALPGCGGGVGGSGANAAPTSPALGRDAPPPATPGAGEGADLAAAEARMIMRELASVIADAESAAAKAGAGEV